MNRVIFVMLLLLAGPVSADCLLNGSWYAEGSIVGDYVCVGGVWLVR